MPIALARAPGGIRIAELGDAGEVLEDRLLPDAALADHVRERETEHPRWVWDSTARWYPRLLEAGVRVERCVDLRLCHAILSGSEFSTVSALATLPPGLWDRAAAAEPARNDGATLFDATLFDATRFNDAASGTPPAPEEPDPVAEYAAQLTAVRESPEPGRLALLLAAESVGSLVAAELRHAGLPWSADRHLKLLERLLGPRPSTGRPQRMAEALALVCDALDDPTLNPDSPVELLRGLQNAGVRVASTRSWELKQVRHPAIPPLLEYKKLARLHSANGWAWLEEWVHGGRFRPTYVPAGVVSGRWASDGGGALQLPRQLREAVVADPGWKLVVADAAQLEPRVLAAMSRDRAMARAGRAQDLYEGMVSSGAAVDRQEAKYGMLGAIYGGTSGVAGRVLPRLRRTFPDAMRFVEEAAHTGEDGRRVSTWLGRTSPAASDAAPGGYDETLSDAQRRSFQAHRRSWGRFTRNFVVQGTAAEWALCWMGAVRRRLWHLGAGPASGGSPVPFQSRPHLAFFLHDELVVHAPAELADAAADALRAGAVEAGRLMFGNAPVEWALTVAVVDGYDQAK